MESLTGLVAFTRVAELKSFAAAARQLGVSASAVGKSVARLEDRLGARLFNRTTRRVTLTEEGEVLYAHCARILAELEEAEALVAASGAAPSGRLRVEMPAGLGRLKVVPMLPAFMDRYPDLELELSFADRLVDPVEAGLDVVVRLTESPDSRLVSRPLGPQRLGVYAAPAYLERRGTPRRPEDLRGHECLALHQPGAGRERLWRFRGADGELETGVSGRLSCSNSEVLVQAAVAALGLIQVPDYVASRALERKELREVLADYRPTAPPITAVWPSNRHLLPRVRVFVEFLVEVMATPGPRNTTAATLPRTPEPCPDAAGSGQAPDAAR